MAKKSEARLGKGLAAIFGEDVSDGAGGYPAGKIRYTCQRTF